MHARDGHSTDGRRGRIVDERARAVRRGSRAFRHLLEVGRRVVARCRRRRDGGIARVGDGREPLELPDDGGVVATHVPPRSDLTRTTPAMSGPVRARRRVPSRPVPSTGSLAG